MEPPSASMISIGIDDVGREVIDGVNRRPIVRGPNAAQLNDGLSRFEVQLLGDGDRCRDRTNAE